MINFSQALDELKRGACICRTGWNGKDMYVYLNKGSHDFPGNQKPDKVREIDSSLFEDGQEGTVTRLPNMNMKLHDDTVLTGWVPTQTDMLSEDWVIIGTIQLGQKEGAGK